MQTIELQGEWTVTLSREKQSETWVKSVNLIGKATPDGGTATVTGYAFAKEDETPNMTEVDNLANISKNKTVTENGTYVFFIEDSEGERYESNHLKISNIDTVKPEITGLTSTSNTITIKATETNITFKQNPENWTNGNVTVEASTTVTSTGYKLQTSKDGQNWEDVYTQEFEENGKMYARLINEENQTEGIVTHDVTNIDKVNPTAGTITATEQTETESEYEFDTWTYENVKIEKVNGTDSESGHKKTTYTVESDGEIIYEDIEETITITQSGIYNITVTTQDNVGNTTVNEYIVKIHKMVPTVILQHDDKNGDAYESGTWTNTDLYGEIMIETGITGHKAEKYQYSYDGQNWYDISAEKADISSNTALTFENYEISNNIAKFTLKEELNVQIYIRAVYEDGETSLYENVTKIKIDKTLPTAEQTNATTSNITIKATDNESGIIGYAITETNEKPSEFKNVGNTKTLTKTIEDLAANTTYYIWIKDEAGNINNTIEIKTEPIPSLNDTNVTFTKIPEDWTNGNVTVTAETTITGYTLQTSKDGIIWNTTNTQIFNKNGTIHARLIDSKNQAGESATHEITNIDKLEPNAFTPTVNVSGSTIEVIASATDKDETEEYGCSGIKEYRFSIDNGETYTEWQTSGTYKFAKLYDGTWTSNDVYVEITTNTDNNITKYQYSYDKQNWSDIETGLENISNYLKTNNKIQFDLKTDTNKEIYIRGIYTEETKTTQTTDVVILKIDKTAPVAQLEKIRYCSTTEAFANIKAIEEGSGLKGYYLNTSETEPTQSSSWTDLSINEFEVNGLQLDTIYYLWLIDNVGLISEKIELQKEQQELYYSVDDRIYTVALYEAIDEAEDGSTIKLLQSYTEENCDEGYDYDDNFNGLNIIGGFNKNIVFDIQDYTFTLGGSICIEGDKIVEITGTGSMKATSYTRIYNYGNCTLSNDFSFTSTIGLMNYLVRNESTGILNINDNAKLTSYHEVVYNEGILNINGGEINAVFWTWQQIAGVGIDNSGKIYMNNGTIIADSGGYGIATDGGSIEIYGGTINAGEYGIYGSNTEVTIGRQEDELSTTSPEIYGDTYGVYMTTSTDTFNFFNGLIKGKKSATYVGELVPRKLHAPYTYQSGSYYYTILQQTSSEITLEANPTTYTNGDVEVKMTFPYESSGKRYYSEDGSNWTQEQQYFASITITENKTIYAKTVDSTGTTTQTEQIEINNIDKENPIVTITNNDAYMIENNTIDIENITIKAEDVGVSGLNVMQYAFAKEGETPNYIDFDGVVTFSQTGLTEGTYKIYINITDNAGNKCETESKTILIEKKPTLKITPENATAYEGNPTTFEAQSTSKNESVEYQWYYDTNNIAGTGTKSGTSATNQITFDTAGIYYVSCVAIVTYGTDSGTKTIASNIAKVEAKNVAKLTITPTESTAYIGNNATFTAIPDGLYTTVTYQWYYNTNNIAGDGTKGGTGSTYSISFDTVGTYYVSCVATFVYGENGESRTAISNIAPIQVEAIPTLKITPANITVVAGNSITLSSTISGQYTSATYQWYYNTSDTAGSGTAGGTNNTYSIKFNTEGTYYISCKAIVTYGTDSGTKTITSSTSIVTVQTANYLVGSTYYNTLATAHAGATSGQTIYTIRDNTDSSTVTIRKDVTLSTSYNSNNYTITRTRPININEGYTFTVTGSGTIKAGSDIWLFYNNGTFNVNSSEINSNGSDYAIAYNQGTMNVTGGKIYSDYAGLYNYESGKLYVSQNANIESNGNTIINDGEAQISGGNIIGTSTINYPALCNMNKLTISDSTTINSTKSVAIYNAEGGNVSIVGGTIHAQDTNALKNEKGTVTIADGNLTTYSDKYVTISCCKGGIIEITGGTITAEGQTNAIANGGNNEDVENGVYEGGTVSILGGTIISYATSYWPAVYNNGTLYVGSSSDTLSTTNPSITSDYCGVGNDIDGEWTGVWYFYNGIIKGKTVAYDGEPTDIRSGCSIETGTSGLYQTKYLK